MKDKIIKMKQEVRDKQKIILGQEKTIREKRSDIDYVKTQCETLKNLIITKKISNIGKTRKSAIAEKTYQNSENAYQNQNADNSDSELNEEKLKYKQMVAEQETKITELKLKLEKIQLEIKQKANEMRINNLKSIELKKQIKILTQGYTMKNENFKIRKSNSPFKLNTNKLTNTTARLVKNIKKAPGQKMQRELLISFEQFRRDMLMEGNTPLKEKKVKGQINSLRNSVEPINITVSPHFKEQNQRIFFNLTILAEQQIDSDRSESLHNESLFVGNQEKPIQPLSKKIIKITKSNM